ncbi:hypothetical protein [Agrococcus jejuensis]|uniref:hypothetical protein n=1 Tax=Agrococcus jejuensis TaxID=399736 RepID=UPI0011A26348|nr:hypothetical protein [Agrococcus jejuensis]
MSDPTEHDAQAQVDEPAPGPESEVHRLDAGGAIAPVGAPLAELRREHPRIVLALAGSIALAGVALVVLAAATGRR